MRKSVPTDLQFDLMRAPKEPTLKFDVRHQTGEILKGLHQVIQQLAGFIQLTEEEQKEAGIFRAFHRYD